MADLLLGAALLLVAVLAALVVGTREPVRQSFVLSAYGLALSVLFVLLHAPDVAMSQLGAGTVLVPLMVVLAIQAIRRHLHNEDHQGGGERAGTDRGGRP